MSDDQKVYTWKAHKYDEDFNGVFDRPLDAYADAKMILEDREASTAFIEIHELDEVKPENYITCDAAAILEEMDQCLADTEGYSSDDVVFDCKDLKAAQAALEMVLKNWAKEHVTCELLYVVGKKIDFQP